MRLGCTLCLAAVLAIGSFSPSLACKGPKVIYSDDFTEQVFETLRSVSFVVIRRCRPV